MRNSFSIGWVIVSYFLICGGVCVAIGGYALAGARQPSAGYAAFFVGAALGGAMAGRASPHRSYLEPALAAALVVGSVLAFVNSTPMGRLLVASYHDQVIRSAEVLAGLGAGGGLLGALVGEATQPRDPRLLGLRWLGLSLFISAGAVLSAGTFAALLLLNKAAEKALGQILTGGIDPHQPLLSQDRVALAATAAGVGAAFLGGLVTQLGAPRRALVPAMLGPLLVMGGAVLAIGAAAGRGHQLVGPAVVVGAFAAAVALVGALCAYLVGRATGRLSGGELSR